ncbi:MAG: hypothetical protein JWM33_3437 [Caulobacteraceae bacterium]|nr:hypothetical protein [Caulobacteraceae bacterium]
MSLAMDDRPAVQPISGGQNIQRIVAPGARATIERISEEGWAEDGKVTLIGLSAVAAQFGERWPARREAVYDHIERSLERHISSDAIYLRVSDTDYLICQPSVEPAVAQGFCLRFMRDVLRHFLGEARDRDISLMQVRQIDEDTLHVAPIDRAAIAQFADGPLSAPAAASPPKAAEPLPPPNPWSPFVSSAGRQLHVSCYLQRMINLKTYDEVGLRIGRYVVSSPHEDRLNALQIAALPRADIERIDKASIYQGLEMLRDGRPRPAIVAVPMSFTTLNSARGRAMLFSACREAAGLVTGGLIAGIYDVEGAPQGALKSTAALVRPFCLRVFANLQGPTKSDIRGLQGGGMDGISIHCPDFVGDAEFIGWARSVVNEAKVMRGAVALHGVSERRAAIAATLGVTHAAIWQD